ncbi:MAG: Epoxide hydrolase, partial [uncultured Gemmatimonadaceae bacterium]
EPRCSAPGLGGGRQRDPPVPHQYSGGGPCRSPPARAGDALAGPRDCHRPFAGRAARANPAA